MAGTRDGKDLAGTSGARRPAAADAGAENARITAQCGTPALTPRETTVLRLLIDGKRNQEISDELSISERTVKFHVSGLFAKLGVSSRTQLVSVALRQGLLEP